MKTMIRVVMDATKGSEAIKSGTMQKSIGAFMEKFRPEATYFATERGMRTAYFVVDMQSANQQVELAEPFFDMGAEVHIAPCMTPTELQAGFAAAGR